MVEPGVLKYRAFISYSHADTAWAKWLHRRLESFTIDKDLAGRETATGLIPIALRPIFRDRDEFTAGHALTEQTLAALDASAALVVICSPSAAKSSYVNEEIRLFKARHAKRPMIPLIVAGKPANHEHECFPPALKFKVDARGRITKKAVEMLAADAREEGDGKELALAKVIAGFLGLSSDDVFRRADRERRAAVRRRQRVQALVGGLGLLLVAGGVGWFNQDYLKERLYWYAIMGATVLPAAKERALQPGDEFSECTNGCPLMAVIPPGTFMMGSPEGQGTNVERPQHKVTLTKAFSVGKYEVTFAEWDKCVAAGGCRQASDDGWGRGERPVINVSWASAEDGADAQQYVTWLSRLTGKTYRLLSEAEWEYAARAGTRTRYSFGDDAAKIGEYAWYQANSGGRTHPVGEKKQNAFGLYDMHGNVWEWVEDLLHTNYDDAPSDGSAWIEGGQEGRRVFRGGSWDIEADFLRSAIRDGIRTGFRHNNLGFRVARTLAP